ncbi:glycosyltransferase [Jatrophihabitans sp. YIM 134969]
MIGWYVHHQGRGHLTRARCVAPLLDEPVVGLSSLPDPGGTFDDWVRLPPDDLATDPGDHTAHGALHWAPVRDASSAARIAALTAWIARDRPRAVVVDVSVEAAVACRLAGVPVVVVAQPGDRSDDVHAWGYRLADAIIAPWAQEVYAPEWLTPWSDKTVYTGAISRYDDRSGSTRSRSARSQPGTVAVLSGAGGRWADDARPPSDLGAWRWQVLDAATGSDDPWTALCDAEVVVSHGGLNAVAEVAAARRPTIVIPQARPFGEQQETARALHQASIAVSTPTWPAPGEWPALLAAATALDPAGWARWSPGDGAARAADVVHRVATGGPPW